MPKKIMIVDDSNTIRTTLALTLKSAGYDVVEASNGVAALDLMKAHNVGLFISDINMPEMDGITFLKKVKDDRDYKHTPVIMLTTENNDEMIKAGGEAGAKAWIVKPFNPETLINTVKKIFVP